MTQLAKTDFWYLLFYDTSEDGTGHPKYVGRTTDSKAALEHERKLKRGSPYCIGYTLVVTDSQTATLSIYALPPTQKGWAELHRRLAASRPLPSL